MALALSVVMLGGSDAVAATDQTVVAATIYPSAGQVTRRSLTVSALAICPGYMGTNPMPIYPGGGEYQVPSSSWSISTVLECGLGLLSSQVNSVQVLNPRKGPESALTGGELTAPSSFPDPQSQPVISTDGSENLNTYFRPYRGGSDHNAEDEVTATGSPITLLVYEDGTRLTVAASQQTVSKTKTAMRVRFATTVHDSRGGPVTARALTWSWTFGDGGGSATQSPTHPFAPGLYPVTVQVTDSSAGEGGSATIEVNASAISSVHHAQPQTGGSRNRDSKSPTGPVNGGGKHPGGPSGSSASPVPAQSPGATGTTADSAKSGTVDRPAGRPGHGNAAAKPSSGHVRPASAPSSSPVPLVSGRLISDVTPLPVGASPLIHVLAAAPATAPAVREAVGASRLPALAAGFAVFLLLGLGAARELRGRGGWPALRSPS